LILGFRRITIPPPAGSGGSRERAEINDHPLERSSDRIRLIAIEMEGVFENEGALPLSVFLAVAETFTGRKCFHERRAM